jgi:hypothetical protein
MVGIVYIIPIMNIKKIKIRIRIMGNTPRSCQVFVDRKKQNNKNICRKKFQIGD